DSPHGSLFRPVEGLAAVGADLVRSVENQSADAAARAQEPGGREGGQAGASEGLPNPARSGACGRKPGTRDRAPAEPRSPRAAAALFPPLDCGTALQTLQARLRSSGSSRRPLPRTWRGAVAGPPG